MAASGLGVARVDPGARKERTNTQTTDAGQTRYGDLTSSIDRARYLAREGQLAKARSVLTEALAQPDRELRLQAQFVMARLWLAVIILMLAGFILRWVSLTRPVRHAGPVVADILGSTGTAIIVSAIVTGLARIFMTRNYRRFEHEATQYVRREVEGELTAIRDSIQRQTDSFVRSVTSLQAMNQSGVTRLYADRQQAGADMAHDMMEPHVRQIRLMAVSFNNFVRELGPLNGAWQHLEDLIRGNNPLPEGISDLDIKALVIDPSCFGASLRSRGESRTPASIAGRLETEAGETAEHMMDLQKNAAGNGVSFEFRLYRIPPLFFLCRTNFASYIQPYYFWPSRHLDIEAPNPVLKCETQFQESCTTSLHDQMENHFAWIWENAAIPATDVLDGKQVGLDRGAHVMGMLNVFDDPRAALQRMLYLLRNAKDHVSLQGVSLDSFFSQGQPLFEAIARLAERHDVKIRCLLLDPLCEQARFRAYREQLFADPKIKLSEYSDDYHKRSALVHDTNDSLNQIAALLPRAGGCFEARLTSSAPGCFMLQVDDSVLIEQYHYGSINESSGNIPVILGKQMPIVEFSRDRSPVYDRDPMRDPVRLLENHFDFVFEYLSTPISEATIAARPW